MVAAQTHNGIPTPIPHTQALLLQHPVAHVRDTARYRPYMRPHGRDGGRLRPRRLKELAQEVLGMEIQEGRHDSVGDLVLAIGCLWTERRIRHQPSMTGEATSPKTNSTHAHDT